MLVKQRDNEIAILVNYLNKKKEGDAGVPLQSQSFKSEQPAQDEEESKQTLFQMMNKPKVDKTVADKRRDFELAQDTIKKANGIPEMSQQ